MNYFSVTFEEFFDQELSHTFDRKVKRLLNRGPDHVPRRRTLCINQGEGFSIQSPIRVNAFRSLGHGHKMYLGIFRAQKKIQSFAKNAVFQPNFRLIRLILGSGKYVCGEAQSVQFTDMLQMVVPRLRESHVLPPPGHGARVPTT